MILSPKTRNIILTNSQINSGTTDKDEYSKVHSFKILLDSSTNASIDDRYVLHNVTEFLKIKRIMVYYGA